MVSLRTTSPALNVGLVTPRIARVMNEREPSERLSSRQAASLLRYSLKSCPPPPPQCLPCSILQLQSGSPLLKGRCTQWMEIPPSVYLLSFESFAARDNWNCWNTGNTIRKSAKKLIFPLVRHGHNKTFKTGAEKQKDMEMCQEQLKLYLEQTRYLSCFLHLSLSNIKDKR